MTEGGNCDLTGGYGITPSKELENFLNNTSNSTLTELVIQINQTIQNQNNSVDC